jgi:hypothetical protein
MIFDSIKWASSGVLKESPPHNNALENVTEDGAQLVISSASDIAFFRTWSFGKM